MKRYLVLVVIFMHLPVQWLYAQAGLIAQITSHLDYSGYVKNTAFFDTRQVNGTRNNLALNFPENRLTDTCGRDIRSVGQFDMLAIETFMSVRASGMKVCKADVSAFISGDFYGVTEDVIDSLRLFEGYIKMAWEKQALLMGQYESPIFVIDCFPNTLSFNTGSPIEPYSLNPQLRYTVKIDSLEFIMAALSEVGANKNYVSTGPNGFSSEYVRNAKIPLLHFQVRKNGKGYFFGVGVDVRTLKPRLVTDKNFKAHEHITSVSAIAYAKFIKDPVVCKMKIIYAENDPAYGLISGYAVQTINPKTDQRTYTNLRAIAAWLDVDVFDGKAVQLGGFLGVLKNIGSSDCLVDLKNFPDLLKDDVIFGFATDVDLVFRASARFVLNLKKAFRFGWEAEYTRASFGKINRHGSVDHARGVGNVRLLFSAAYLF